MRNFERYILLGYSITDELIKRERAGQYRSAQAMEKALIAIVNSKPQDTRRRQTIPESVADRINEWYEN